MKSKKLTFLAVSIAALISFVGCELSGIESFGDSVDSRKGRPSEQSYVPEIYEGTEADVLWVNPDSFGYQGFTYGLWAGQDIEAGTVTISNDQEFFSIFVETLAALDEVHVSVYTSLDDIPSSRPAPGLAPYSAKDINSDSVLIEIPVGDIANGSQYYFIIHAALIEGADEAYHFLAGETAYAAGPEAPSFGGRGAWFYVVGYAVTEVHRTVDDDVLIAVGDFRTQTQGGWGTNANGNNPGVYRDANFAGAFPNGAVIGGGFTLTFTSSAAVEAFLPAGGSPQALTASAVDPSSGNVFAGQVLALTISVGFDLYDEDFGASDLNLKDLVFAGGTFEGWSVEDVLAEANFVLGGGSSAFSASELNDAVASVNENFVDGTEVGDALRLP